MDTFLEKRVLDVIRKFDLKDKFWFVKSVNVEPISQSGPQCGIVALCMALKYMNINCSVEDLMKYAREKRLTKSGEIFNIDYLKSISNQLGSKCSVKKLESSDDEVEILKLLLKNKLILIAYDCDSNFEPCNKNGLKAHWALLIGLILPIDKKYSEIFSKNEDVSSDYIYTSESFEEKHDEILNNCQSNDIHVICRQGKSKHCGVWSLSKLIESNKQLKLIDNVKCDDENFVKPQDGDLQKTLAHKYLVFE